MGEVIVTFKVLPESVDADLEVIAEKLKDLSNGRFNSIEKEPIAFGLIALKPSYVVSDRGGVVDDLEAEIVGIIGVKSSEVVDLSLV